MRARRLNLRNAAIEGALLVAMMVCGFLGAWKVGLAMAAVMLVYWLVTRWQALISMPLQQRATKGGLGAAVLVLCAGGAYALGASLKALAG